MDNDDSLGLSHSWSTLELLTGYIESLFQSHPQSPHGGQDNFHGQSAAMILTESHQRDLRVSIVSDQRRSTCHPQEHRELGVCR